MGQIKDLCHNKLVYFVVVQEQEDLHARTRLASG